MFCSGVSYISNLKCTFIFQIELKRSIYEAIYVHDVLHKRKPFLDQLMAGLGELGMAEPIMLFPEVFEPLFVGCSHLSPEDVLHIIRAPESSNMSESEIRVYGFLKQFIQDCEKSGLLLDSVYSNFE